MSHLARKNSPWPNTNVILVDWGHNPRTPLLMSVFFGCNPWVLLLVETYHENRFHDNNKVSHAKTFRLVNTSLKNTFTTHVPCQTLSSILNLELGGLVYHANHDIGRTRPLLLQLLIDLLYPVVTLEKCRDGYRHGNNPRAYL